MGDMRGRLACGLVCAALCEKRERVGLCACRLVCACGLVESLASASSAPTWFGSDTSESTFCSTMSPQREAKEVVVA